MARVGLMVFHLFYNIFILRNTVLDNLFKISSLTKTSFLQGLNVLIPILDRIRYVQSLKEIVIDVPEQSAVTLGE